MMRTQTKYLSYLCIAILIFSTFEVVSKTTIGSISSYQLTFYRFLIGGIFLLPIGIHEIKKNNIHLKLKDFIRFFIFGFLLVFCSMNLSQLGIAYSNASMSAVLFSSNPLFVALFSAFFINEKLTPVKISGFLIGVLGLVISCLHLFSSNSISVDFIKGIVLIIIAMLVFAFYTVMNKKYSSSYSNIITISFSSLFGSITSLPLVFIANNSDNPFTFDLSAIPLQFIYLSIFGTGLAYYLYFEALNHLDTSIGSMSFFIKPGLASILSAIVLSEPITLDIVIGIILILIGVYISIDLFSDIKIEAH